MAPGLREFPDVASRIIGRITGAGALASFLNGVNVPKRPGPNPSANPTGATIGRRVRGVNRGKGRVNGRATVAFVFTIPDPIPFGRVVPALLAASVVLVRVAIGGPAAVARPNDFVRRPWHGLDSWAFFGNARGFPGLCYNDLATDATHGNVG